MVQIKSCEVFSPAFFAFLKKVRPSNETSCYSLSVKSVHGEYLYKLINQEALKASNLVDFDALTKFKIESPKIVLNNDFFRKNLKTKVKKFESIPPTSYNRLPAIAPASLVAEHFKLSGFYSKIITFYYFIEENRKRYIIIIVGNKAFKILIRNYRKVLLAMILSIVYLKRKIILKFLKALLFYIFKKIKISKKLSNKISVPKKPEIILPTSINRLPFFIAQRSYDEEKLFDYLTNFLEELKNKVDISNNPKQVLRECRKRLGIDVSNDQLFSCANEMMQYLIFRTCTSSEYLNCVDDVGNIINKMIQSNCNKTGSNLSCKNFFLESAFEALTNNCFEILYSTQCAKDLDTLLERLIAMYLKTKHK